MKQKLILKDGDKIIEKELTIRNIFHFEIQRKNNSRLFTPKKGKGSFKRNKKVREDE